MRLHRLRCIVIFLAAVMLIFPSGRMSAQDQSGNINMIISDVQSLTVNGLTRVSVTNPDIADIADAKEGEVSIVARRKGHTILFVWDKDGKKTYAINVASDDLVKIKDRLQALLADAGISTIKLVPNYVEGKVVISGNINKDQKGRLEKVLSPFEDQVMNLCKEGESQELVQIDMQIVEVSETFDRDVGMIWSGDTGGGDLKFRYQESTNTFVNGSKDWFKIGQFNRANTINTTINLLENQGKARTLSRPRILVTSGKEATVNVGGEVPISSTVYNSATGSGSSSGVAGTAQSNVTFKQYGLTVTVTPTIKEDKIDIELNLQISDIDSTFPVPASSTNGVAYKTRTAQTKLMVDNKQTVLLAGLIRYIDTNQSKSVPVLGKLPIVGSLFNHHYKQSPDEAKELVVTLTPVIQRNKLITNEQIKIPSKGLNEAIDSIEKQNQYQHEEIDAIPDVDLADRHSRLRNRPSTKKTSRLKESPEGTLNAAGALSNVPAKINGQPVTSLQRYMQDIQAKISRNITYPYEALKNKWQGTVKLRLHILRDGTLMAANVVQSSGRQVFDSDAENAAKISAPYPPFQADMQAADLNVTIPIVYQAK